MRREGDAKGQGIDYTYDGLNRVQTKTYSESGLMTGGVSSTSGQPVAGATVTIWKDGVVVVTTTTDAQGNYRASLYPGWYVASATFQGYSSLSAGGIVISGSSTTVNLPCLYTGGVIVGECGGGP